MSAKWMGYFLDEATDLEGTELLLAIAIADHADAHGRAYPGYELLARKIRRTTRHVKELIKSLEARGYVEVARAYGRGNLSTFQLKKVQQASPFQADEKGEAKGEIPAPEKVKFPAEKGEVATSSPPIPPYKDEPFEPSVGNREPRASDFGPPRNGTAPPMIAGYSFRGYRELLDTAASHLRHLDNREAIERLWKSKAPPLDAISCLTEMRKDTWRKATVTWKMVADFYPDWVLKRGQEEQQANGQTHRHSQRDRDAIDNVEFAESLRNRREQKKLYRGTDAGDHGRIRTIERTEDEGPGSGHGSAMGE